MEKVCSFCQIKPISEHTPIESLDCYTKAVKATTVGSKDVDGFMHDNFENAFRAALT